MELGTDEHVKKIIFIEKLTEFYLSYIRVLVSMGSSASMRIRTSVYCCSMCSIDRDFSRRKSGGILAIAAPAVPQAFWLGTGYCQISCHKDDDCHQSMEQVVNDSDCLD